MSKHFRWKNFIGEDMIGISAWGGNKKENKVYVIYDRSRSTKLRESFITEPSHERSEL